MHEAVAADRSIYLVHWSSRVLSPSSSSSTSLSLLSLSAHWHPALQKSRFLEPCDLFLSHRQIDSDPSRRPAGPTHARKIINSSSPTTRKNYQLLRTGRPEPIGPIHPLVMFGSLGYAR